MLILVAHAGIGAGIETLLRLERRYEVRWVRSAAEAESADWRPDIVVAEKGTLGSVALPHPTIVLVGELPPGAASNDTGTTRWMRKASTGPELVAAIDEMLGLGERSRDRRFSTAQLIAAAIGILIVLALAAFFLRIAST